MSSKIILLLGGLISSIVVFFCLKDEYKSPLIKNNLNKQNLPVVTIKEKETNTTTLKTQKTLKQPELFFNATGIKATINKSYKDIYNSLKELNISKDITYSGDINDSYWIKNIPSYIRFFKENNISDAIIIAKGDKVDINATFPNKKIYEKFQNILDKNNSKLSDNTVFIIPKQKETNTTLPTKNINHDTNQTVKNIAIKKTQKQTTYKNRKILQQKINKILRKYPIYFKFDSDVITAKGKRTLNKIISILKNKKAHFVIRVEGHSNAVGNEAYNKVLSKKRAISVKKYLQKHLKNIEKIYAKGYGSSKPLLKNPKDKRNRRVEIIILKGSL